MNNDFDVLDHVPKDFFMIKKSIFYEIKKSSSAFVYCVLASFSNNQTKSCYPSIKKIMDLTGLGNQAIISAIRFLEENNFIKIEKRKSKNGFLNNVYILIQPKKITSIKKEQDINTEKKEHIWFD